MKLQDFGNSPDLVGDVGNLLKVQPTCGRQCATRPYTSDQNATANTIHYNDVTKFLDSTEDAENGLNGAQIMRSSKTSASAAETLPATSSNSSL